MWSLVVVLWCGIYDSDEDRDDTGGVTGGSMEEAIAGIVGTVVAGLLSVGAIRVRNEARGTEATRKIEALLGDAVTAAAGPGLKSNHRRWRRDTRELIRDLDRPVDSDDDPEAPRRALERQVRARLSHRAYGGLDPDATIASRPFWAHLTDERVKKLRDEQTGATLSEGHVADVLLAAAAVLPRQEIRELLVAIGRDMTDGERLPAYLPEDLDVGEITRPVTVRTDEEDRPEQREPEPVPDATPEPPGPGNGDSGSQPSKPGHDRRTRRVRREVVMPWPEALRGAPRLVVLGEPGYGKSWLIRAETARLAKAAVDDLDAGAAPEALVAPIAVRCDELVAAPDGSGTERLISVLRERFRDNEVSERALGWLAERIQERHAVVFVDAWDELPGTPEQAVVKKALATLPAASDGEPGRIVLTSRPADYTGAPVQRPYREVQLRPFATDDVEAVLAAWGLDDQADRLLHDRLEEPAIAEMARNPLLLALLCLVAGRDRELPSARWDLYERVVDEFAMRDRVMPATADGGTDPRSHDRLLRLLGRVATHFATRPGGWVDDMTADDVRLAVESAGYTAKEAPAEIGRMIRSGLVTASRARTGRLPESYRFVHRTIAAFFVARNLAHETEDVRVVVDRQLWGNSAWADVVALLGSRRPEEVIGHLLDVGDDPFHLALRMAARVVTETSEQDVPADQIDRIADRLLTLLPPTKISNIGGPGERLREALGGLMPRVPAVTLRRVLDWATTAEEYDLRPVLAGVARRAAVRVWVVKRIGSDSDGFGARAAVELASDMLDDDRIVEALVGLLRAEGIGAWYAATALAPGVEQARIREELITAARERPGNVSEQAFEAIGEFAGDDTIRSILLAAAGHKDSTVRANAMYGLGPVAAHEDARRALVAGVTDDDALVRIKATSLLRELVDFADVRARLVEILADRTIDADVRAAVANALGSHRDDEAIAAALLRVVRDDPDDRVRRTAAAVLEGAAWLAENQARDIAAAAGREPETLPDVTTPGGRKALVELLASAEDDDVIYQAARKLPAVMGDAFVRAELVRSLAGNPRRAVRSEIIDAFAARDDDDARLALLDLATGDVPPEVRGAAIRGLAGGLHRPEVIAVVVAALASAEFSVQSAATAQVSGYSALSDDDATRQLMVICQALDGAPRQARVEAFAILERRATRDYGAVGDEVDRAFIHRVLSRITRDATVGFVSAADDLDHLRRCIALATQALDVGDEPFGSVLVGPDGTRLHEGHNHVASGDGTQHPELMLAQWAATELSPDLRAGSTVYTSGEHCPMCAAAHAWAGLGRIVFATSSAQVTAWLAEWGVPPSPVRPLPIHEVAPDVDVVGPVPELADEVRELHRRFHRR